MAIVDKSNIFIEVIENHKGIIFKIANTYCKDDDRDDLVQEIIIKLWASFDNYDDSYKYSTWIYRIALNAAISYYRKERTRSKVAAPFSESIFNIADSPDNKKLEQNISLLQKFISQLKDLDKALMLLYLEEKSHKEIAEIMGITETNVATKISRIKNTLKQNFSQIQN